MGTLTALALRLDIPDKRESLRLHLEINFYQPLAGNEIEDTISAIEEFWAGNRDLDVLAKKCHMSDEDELLRCHWPWLEELVDE